jgi:hypothetical protein
MKEDLFSNLKLRRNDSNINIGDRGLILDKGILDESVELRKDETSSLLLLRDTILGTRSRTSPYVNL